VKAWLVLALVLVFAATAQAATSADCWDGVDGAVLWWDMNADSSPSVDLCGRYNGTWSAGVAGGVASRWTNATNFNADGEHSVTASSPIDWAEDWMVSSWYKPAGIAANNREPWAAVGHAFCIKNGATLSCTAWDGAAKTVTYGTALVANNYYHIFFTYDKNSRIHLYINGTYQGNASVGTVSSSSLVFSASRNTAGYHAEGDVDELSVYNYTDTPTNLCGTDVLGATCSAGTMVYHLFNNNSISAGAPAAATPYGVLADTYSTPVYETADTNFVFSLWTNTTNITSADASLWWNGTKYATTSYWNSTTGDNNTYQFNYNDFSLPLVTANFTNMTTMWEYNLTWVNGTTTSTNYTANTQAVYHGFYWGTYAPDAAVLELTTLDFSATPTIAAGTNSSAITSLLALFNNSNYTLTGSGGTWTGTTTAPDVTAPSEAFTSNATIYLAWTGEPGDALTATRLSSNVTITVYEPGISTTCAGGDYAVNFTFFEETIPTTTNHSNMDMSFSWWANADHSGTQYNGTANATSTLNVTLCLSPAWATLYMDSFQVYRNNASSSAVRNYFLTNATVTNTTTTINLFNILAAESSMLTLSITENLVSQPDVYVLMERYYPGENLYRTVEVGKTAADGKTFLYPMPNDVYYRFLVIKDYEVVYSGEPREIGIDTFTIDIGEGRSLEYFDYQGISVSCNMTGTVIGCSLVNPSGLSVGAALLVRQIGIYRDTEICYETAPSVTSTVLLCDTAGYTGDIQADLMFIAPESLLNAWSARFNSAVSDVFGGLGLLIAVLIIAGSALMLAVSPGLALIGAVFGLVISVVTGIAALSVGSVILILVAAAFLIVKVRS